jgi:hypothetical protein
LAQQGTDVLDTKIKDLDAMFAYLRDKSPVAAPSARIQILNQ